MTRWEAATNTGFGGGRQRDRPSPCRRPAQRDQNHIQWPNMFI